MFSYITSISLTATNEHYMVAVLAASTNLLERRQVMRDRVDLYFNHLLVQEFSNRSITNCDQLAASLD